MNQEASPIWGGSSRSHALRTDHCCSCEHKESKLFCETRFSGLSRKAERAEDVWNVLCLGRRSQLEAFVI
eukprot:1612540-Amphidinium_carterae.2